MYKEIEKDTRNWKYIASCSLHLEIEKVDRCTKTKPQTDRYDTHITHIILP